MEPSLNFLRLEDPAGNRRRTLRSLMGSLILLITLTAPAAIQFDVFLGYNRVVPFAAWFPVVCEVRNDGASFSGEIVVSSGSFGKGMPRRLPIELPTGTLKRVVIPVFQASLGVESWDFKLYDDRRTVRAEVLDVQPRLLVGPSVPLMGSLSRTPAGAPAFKAVPEASRQMQPISVELQSAIFPDSPLTLEGLQSLYLNSGRASDLSPSQVRAILSWIETGGHLFVVVEQPSDLGGAPWLGNLLRLRLEGGEQVFDRHPELHRFICDDGWNTNFFTVGTVARPAPVKGFNPDDKTFLNPFEDLGSDPVFEASPLQMLLAARGGYKTILEVDGHPAVLSAQRGRGRVTCLLFNPEREPVKSWKHLGVFWSRVAEVPLQFYAQEVPANRGGWSSDAIYASLIETRQVQKLPVGWLMLLLFTYLIVIGPLDRVLLKRLGRPGLTWITFPCYVLFFSGLVYVIGFRLRSGELEWGELNIVDVPGGRQEKVGVRGRTYASIYSPANRTYALSSSQPLAALRAEFSGSWGGHAGADAGTISQTGGGFRADVPVPVWSSRLLVADWYAEMPSATGTQLRRNKQGWEGEVENRTGRVLSRVALAVGDSIHELGQLGPHEKRTVNLIAGKGGTLGDFVERASQDFNQATSYRMRAFGQQNSNLSNGPDSLAIAASFLEHSTKSGSSGSFQQPATLELTPFIRRGGAVLFCWEPDYAPSPGMLQVVPPRIRRNTLWREFITLAEVGTTERPSTVVSK